MSSSKDTKTKRPSWDETGMNTAIEWARRSVCLYHQIGCAFLTKDHRVAATGYNGPPKGVIHCTDVGCAKDGGKACRGAHAEMNAIMNCAGAPTEVLRGSTLYITQTPCNQCMKQLANLKITRVVFGKIYKRHKRKGEEGQAINQEFKDTLNQARAAGIEVDQYNTRTKKAKRIA